ncbi:uncharacterized protein CCOS01_12309 [Colletotrichum costaricense]|uniref:Uncharacterized protein n=2 Tax=Colletotrichum acutatum species complex TaxID=2707335 RepID=A0AAI9YPD7_9PEZI|nr:uncharacterized protein CCOS01_12309 [Colletotrichum costaricense]XP_060373157.1 uncharacterized protein CTAM01_16279 [Colletotrichum tamarilloi]KAK1472820.1 hypothetical protein CTAM01_16279 [Colletotrichum tamarilloi]KAK1518052.1 hypothetical protein CCOS01_12309 [Colletotrichum costaricense]
MTECERNGKFDDRPLKVWHFVTELFAESFWRGLLPLGRRTGQVPVNKNMASMGHAGYFCLELGLIGRLTEAAVREHYISEMVACVAGHD